MNLICIGLIFVLLNYNISLNGITFSVLPDFVGFFLIFYGLRREKIGKLNNAELMSACLGMYTLFQFIFNVLKIKLGILDMLINIAFIFTLIVLLYFLCKINNGTKWLYCSCFLSVFFLIATNLLFVTQSYLYAICCLLYVLFSIIFIVDYCVLAKKGKMNA